VICPTANYGTTACKWDVVIPFEPLWEQYKHIIKDRGAIVLFGSEPFSSYLRLSNLDWYKHDLYWKKEKPTNFFQLKKRFGKTTENILVFYKKQPTYNPQKVKHEGKLVSNKPKGNHNSIVAGINKKVLPYTDDGTRYPNDILEFRREVLGTTVHPTQKPVALLEYLIKTYTLENEIVLDNTMGSGSTGVACVNTNRNFIGIEKDDKYFEIAVDRIADAREKKANEKGN
jgi:DNA modification methylase